MNQINGFNFHSNQVSVSGEQGHLFPPAEGPGSDGAWGCVDGLPEALAAATPA